MDVLFWVIVAVVVGQAFVLSRLRAEIALLKAWNTKLAKITADHAVYLDKTDPGWKERTLLF
jgi:hypothetical protein